MRQHLHTLFEKLPRLKPLLDPASTINADHYNNLRTLRICIMYGAHYNKRDFEKDRVFFLDIVARKLLLCSCIQ